VKLMSILLGASCLVLLTRPSISDGQDNVKALLDGVIARGSVIQTGEFKYRFGSLWANPADPSPWSWDPSDDRTVSLTVAGSEWIVRWPNFANADIHRKDFDATYVPIRQKNGEMLHSFRISDSVASLESEAINSQMYRFIRAGTIPWPLLQEYLVKNRSDATDKGAVEVDGVSTHLIEWKVTKENYKVLQSYNPVLSDKYDATLIKLFVCPKMGYVVKRLDYCTPSGEMANRYEADEFKELAPGVFMPKFYFYIRNFYDFGNKKGYYVDQFELIEASKVNQSIPESAFALELPKGTRVADYRSSKPETHFATGSVVDIAEIDQVINARANVTPDLSKPAYFRKSLIWINLVVLLLIGALIARRRMQIGGKKS
jgi:hypothetical protein